MPSLGRHQAVEAFWVDWWLINRCDFHCGYCHELMRSGSIAQITAEQALDFVRRLADQMRERGRATRYHLTGGEVTLWPWLGELLEEMRLQGAEVSVRSNLNQSPLGFRRLAPLITVLLAEYHPGYTQKSRFIMSVETALEAGARVTVQLQMVPDLWQELAEIEAELRQRWPTIDIMKRMLYLDPIKNHMPGPYDPEQRQQLISGGGPILVKTPDGESFTNYQALVLKDENRFSGWRCRAGLDQIVVDAWGVIYGSHCRQGGRLGVLGEAFQLPSQELICWQDRCRNAFDILATKTLD